MGLLTMIATAILGLISAVFVALLKDEAVAHMPKLNKFIIASAVSRLPEGDRERFNEEWTAHVNEYSGKLSQLYQCILCLKAGMSKEEFDSKFVDEKFDKFMLACVLTTINQAFTENLYGNGYWIDHLVSFANYVVTVFFVWSAYWMIRLKPQISRKIEGSMDKR